MRFPFILTYLIRGVPIAHFGRFRLADLWKVINSDHRFWPIPIFLIIEGEVAGKKEKKSQLRECHVF